MANSRGLRDAVVRALAKVGLVWALAVLGALFMATSAAGIQQGSGGYSAAAADASAAAPRSAGVVLAVIVLTTGMAVLAFGALRPDRRLR